MNDDFDFIPHNEDDASDISNASDMSNASDTPDTSGVSEAPVVQPPICLESPPGIHYVAPPQKKRHVGRRVIAAVLVVAILGGTIGIFSNFFEISMLEDGFSVRRRSAPTTSIYSPPQDASETYTPQVAVKTPDPDAPSLTILGTQTPAGALTIQEIAQKCTPATVFISAMSDSFYYGSTASSGSGIIMSEDGYIITNNHVIEGATSLSVMLYDGREYEAQLVGGDSRSDLAVLKISASGLEFAEFGDSDAVMVGDPVVAVGNPLGKNFIGTVTNGIISAINRDVVVEERTMTLLQTNAAINSGNSGGPLINQYGQVIGITNMKMQSMSSVVEGLGFAIPTNTAKTIIDELISHGYVQGYPTIGINYNVISERMSQYYNIPMGILVEYINPSANSYAAGLQINDIIIAAAGETVQTAEQLSAIKDRFKAGEEFTIKVYRYSTKTEHDITFILNDEHELTEDGGRLIP